MNDLNLEQIAEEINLPRRARAWTIHPSMRWVTELPAYAVGAEEARRYVPDPIGRLLFGEDLWD